jgi:CO/xanthine dehydrogenase FAD-binding subunit
MFTIDNYIVVKDMEEAYQLNQKRNNVILGGGLWLGLGSRSIRTAIDLSGLGLDRIEEREDSFEIGCMTTLRELECNATLNSCFNGVFRKATKPIVGVQFRNCATIGGSIYGRYGFSDLLTCLLALHTEVVLYRGGTVLLSDFVDMPRDKDVLIKLVIKKDSREVAYLTHRRAATDFPVLTCAVARTEREWQVVVGARPSRAKLIREEASRLGILPSESELNNFCTELVQRMDFSTNMRGSEEYRRHLAGVLIFRSIKEIMERGDNDDENKTVD